MIRILALAIFALVFAPVSADAASCSVFAKLVKYDPVGHQVTLKYVKNSERKFFPRPEGGGNTPSKLPKQCRGKVKKKKSFKVTPTGGRLTVTQVRSNFSGKMLNDTEDPEWVPRKIQELVDSGTAVAVVIRPGLGKDAPLGVTTIYLPITDEERKEIARIEAQVEDVD